MKNKKDRLRRKGLQVLPGEGKRFTSLKHALVFYLLLAMAAAVIVQFGYHWLGGQFLAWRLKIVTAETGIMQREYTVEGLITRSEEVYRAPASGLIIEMAPGGERVSSGFTPVVIGVIPASEFRLPEAEAEEEGESEEENGVEEENGEATDFDYWADLYEAMLSEGQRPISPGEANLNNTALIYLKIGRPGFLSYYTDGWESYGGSPYLARNTFEMMGEEVRETSIGAPVAYDDPVFKIVDNWQWFYSFSMPLEPGRDLAQQSNLSLVFDFYPDKPVTAFVVESEVDQGGQAVRITCRIDRQLDGFDRARYSSAVVEYDHKRGIIVPAGAVFENDSGPGVFINQGGRVVFKPVRVVESRGDEVMVEDLPEYSLVISHPELVEEGQRLN